MTHPTIGPQFDSDEAAQLILRELLRGNFIVRDHKPDFFLDYHVERRINGEPSGETVFVQLKGQRELRQNDDMGKVQLETKALRYYATVEIPVFIALIDVTKKQGFYLFVQRWLDEMHDRIDFSANGRVTVSVPLKNDLANIPKFIADCQQARRAMREKYPGTPEAALRNYASQYTGLDPRFSVQAYFGPQGKSLHISATQTTEVQFSFKSKAGEVVRQLVDAANYGKPISISDVLIQAHGSPLFEKLLSGDTPAKIEWQSDAPVDCFLGLSCTAPDAQFSLQLPIQLTRGARGIAYHTTAGDCPLTFDGRIEAPPNTHRSKSGGLKFRSQAWLGKPILTLPWYQGMMGFVLASSAQKKIRAALIYQGNEAFVSELSGSWCKGKNSEIVRWFEWVKIVRTLGEAVSSNVALPEACLLSEESLNSLVKAYHVLTTGRLPSDGFGFSISKSGNENWWSNVMPDLRTKGESVGLFRLSIPHHFDFLGKEESLGELRIDDLSARIRPAPGADVSSEESIAVHVTAADGGDIIFHLVRESGQP